MRRSRLCLGLLLAVAFAPVTRPAEGAAANGGRSLLAALSAANDRLVAQVLANGGLDASPLGVRNRGPQVMMMAVAHAHSGSVHYRDARLLVAIGERLDWLESTRNPSGLWSLGNLDSPPDSAFILKMLAKAQLRLEQDADPASLAIRGRLKTMILATAEGVRQGGVHTPNHRWAICSALAYVNHLYPNPAYVARIDEWLAEGIDVDADGLWAERSANYTSDVNNPALVDLARLLNRPELLEPVRRSLEASRYFFEPNGEVETVASRRQDQRAQAPREYVWEWYYPYRYLAAHDGNPRYAAIARWIEESFLDEVGSLAGNMSSPLTVLLEDPVLERPLPPGEPVPARFARVFPLSGQVRLRQGPFTATVFGGSDWYAGLGHGSGLSTNPTFFKLRKGAAILESVRMTPAFFSTGHFYSEGLRTEGGGYVLWQDLDVPYHLPLPAEKRRADGQYPLQADMASSGVLARFFSRMGFADRPKQVVSLRTTVTVTEQTEGYALSFAVDGPPGVGVTIELAFRPGGTFDGLTSGAGADGPASPAAALNRGTAISAAEAADTFLLKSGYATYTVGSDRLEFGPGSFVRPPGRMEGEAFTWVGGALPAPGQRVYLTGVTPFRHTLTFK